MADRLKPEQRSALMAKVKGKDTGVELRVRRLLHGAGYRFIVHSKRFPGTPDIVFTRRRKVIFVHGCFWHGHEGCKRSTAPSSRIEFWSEKLRRNRERDKATLATLTSSGWDVLTIWECEIADGAALEARLIEFLGPRRS
ncbi:very short patch repair endonuclease [Mesorhizobium atlanticum]|uniref:Very short patch repair endonuclease n=1 Tax=Mesorhizobium atlanticum TaxID=2233532 RepID=A0A330H564_9HYPH|nr:very short patch repair endonuclease [Mesorhizobium atlanticum]RAZ78251.1 very short patch repair endonuclease [Mesorhizobium atlanticum]